ncbi:uncharacterized protein LOC119612525 [Lucilia sericata]|uniref:uncharacterized protein LOC119612525 n=1 Tax=Lucilia sericata TaxID=13632 RepID=UPI0018A85BD1|nr:uncharacterized protein LOC119612525 [Lucilia sericata]
MFKNLFLLFVIGYSEYCKAYNNTTYDFNGLTERKSRANLVSFEPLGEHIQVGLDYLMPFIKVPIVRKVDIYGNEPALININTAAIVSTGLLATSSALISFIFRRYVVLGREATSSEHRRRSDNDFEQELWSILNNFKLVYTNSSGSRVDTSLSGLFDTINETFQKNGIDLSSCIQKAICIRLQLSADRVNEGNSSGVDKIIDGLMGIKWFRSFLRHTTLKDVLDLKEVSSFSNKQYDDKYPIYCDNKYPHCKWSAPEDNIVELVSTYLKFT